jgi:hypothetical protein
MGVVLWLARIARDRHACGLGTMAGALKGCICCMNHHSVFGRLQHDLGASA